MMKLMENVPGWVVCMVSIGSEKKKTTVKKKKNNKEVHSQNSWLLNILFKDALNKTLVKTKYELPVRCMEGIGCWEWYIYMRRTSSCLQTWDSNGE